jgi:hypothetical protein
VAQSPIRQHVDVLFTLPHPCVLTQSHCPRVPKSSQLPFSRTRYGWSSPNVHRGAQISRSSPWPLEYDPHPYSFLNFPSVGAGGFRAIFHAEGWRDLYRGTSLALFGVSNGAPLFMGYEKIKGWAFERKRQRVAKLGRAWTTDDNKPVRVFSPLCVP